MLDPSLHVDRACKLIEQASHNSTDLLSINLPGRKVVDAAGCKFTSFGVCSAQKLFALARVFGNIPDDLFSRSYEAMIFRTVARAGMGPKLLVGAAPGAI